MGGVIIAVSGMPGSGKSIVSRILSRRLGCPVLSMGDAVRREVARRGLEVNAVNVERVASELRREYGMAAVAVIMADDVKRTIDENGCAVIDGVRGRAEIEVFASIARVCVVAVHASPATRYRRMAERGRRGETWEVFRMRDEYNLRFGIGEVIALADYMLVNEWGLDELERQVDWVVGDLNGEDPRCGGGGGEAHREPR